MKRAFSISIILLLAASAIFADIARPGKSPGSRVPKPKRGIDTNLSIRLDRNATEARLIIPKSQIKQLRAELEQMDGDEDATAAVNAPSSLARTQTIMSGLFLSLAFVFGGMWLVGFDKAAGKAGKGVIVLAVGLGVASSTLLFANIAPPLIVRSITGKIFSQDMQRSGAGWGKIKLEVSEADQVELVVPNPIGAPAE